MVYPPAALGERRVFATWGQNSNGLRLHRSRHGCCAGETALYLHTVSVLDTRCWRARELGVEGDAAAEDDGLSSAAGVLTRAREEPLKPQAAARRHLCAREHEQTGANSTDFSYVRFAFFPSNRFVASLGRWRWRHR